MKKMNNKGFVLAETLVVTVFLMVLFTMIYSNYYPLIGEYQKREAYDDLDGKYSAYWVKKLIEDTDYPFDNIRRKINDQGYHRFQCSDYGNLIDKRKLCNILMKDLEISNCSRYGDGCDIYITAYKIGGVSASSGDGIFKEKVAINESTKNSETNALGTTYNDFCTTSDSAIPVYGNMNLSNECNKIGSQKVFGSAVRDYINALPDYKTPSINNAEYRVIIAMHHKKISNYYSYATIEVDR